MTPRNRMLEELQIREYKVKRIISLPCAPCPLRNSLHPERPSRSSPGITSGRR